MFEDTNLSLCHDDYWTEEDGHEQGEFHSLWTPEFWAEETLGRTRGLWDIISIAPCTSLGSISTDPSMSPWYP